MKCKFEHDGNCCNSGAKQYMHKCQKPCDAIIQMTNAQKIRSMSDEDLKEFICSVLQCEFCKFEGWGGCELLDWLQQPAE